MPINICNHCKKEFYVKGIKRSQKAICCSIKCSSENKSYVVIEGTKNNMLTLLKEVDREIQGSSKIRKVLCQCDCGEKVITRLTSFRTGYAKSCGCIDKIGRDDSDKSKAISRHPLHRVWSNMVQRCTNKNNRSYKNYGGRGVKVCKEWLESYKVFYEWALSNGWKRGLKLDKDIANKKMYSPKYCVFISNKENSNYQSRSLAINYNNKRLTTKMLIDITGYSYITVAKKIKNGKIFNILKDMGYD